MASGQCCAVVAGFVVVLLLHFPAAAAQQLPFDGSPSCSAYLTANPAMCGCYFRNETFAEGGWVNMPLTASFERLILSQSDFKVTQGCCSITHAKSQPLVGAVGWGACADSQYNPALLSSKGW
eukprot:Sspe_Gene.86723::Locus_57469_Transcript_1_1_Confidence_1.000_Length_446::g.86723::m.86723